jgi:hypothetical protein
MPIEEGIASAISGNVLAVPAAIINTDVVSTKSAERSYARRKRLALLVMAVALLLVIAILWFDHSPR